MPKALLPSRARFHSFVPLSQFSQPPVLTFTITAISVTQRPFSSLRQERPRQQETPVKYLRMERDYQTALRLLNSLQSNFAVTSLFKPEPSASNEPKRDLNAQAIPEMLHWLRRAGYTPEDLIPLKTIHIAGTKGKGSVTAFCTSMLLRFPAAGLVGTYTSPPYCFSERTHHAGWQADQSRALYQVLF